MDNEPLYCPDCGAPIKDGASFCGKCGTKVVANTNQSAEGGAPVPPKRVASNSPVMPGTSSANTSNTEVKEKIESSINTEEISAKAKDAKKKFDGLDKKKKYGIIAGIAVVIIAIILAMRPATINLNDYMAVDFDGYNGYGTAYVIFDENSFAKATKGKLKLDKKDKEALKIAGSILGNVDSKALEEGAAEIAAYAINSSLYSSVKIDPESGLSNGDEVKVSCTIDTDMLEKAYGCKFECSDFTKTVEGLQEVETYDPFAGVNITFEGTSDNPTINVSRAEGADKNTQIGDFYIHDSNISNGDEVEVTCIPNGEDEQSYMRNLALSGQKVPSPVSKTIKVTGIKEFVVTKDQLTDEVLEKLEKEATDIIDAQAARWGSSNDTCVINEKTYLGNYILSAKKTDGFYYGSKHKLILVYKLNANYDYDYISSTGSSHDVNSYVAIEFDSCTVDDKGNVDYEGQPEFKAGKFPLSENGFSRAIGYETQEELYKNLVVKDADSFNHEDNISE